MGGAAPKRIDAARNKLAIAVRAILTNLGALAFFRIANTNRSRDSRPTITCPAQSIEDGGAGSRLRAVTAGFLVESIQSQEMAALCVNSGELNAMRVVHVASVAHSESTSPSAAIACHPALVSRTPGLFNAMDMSFLHHAECNLAELMALQGDTRPIINLVLNNALQAPYLVDQLLALSALHLSSQNGTLKSIYHQQATELRSRALTVFNKDEQDISESNHLSSFLFATFLGIHVLADTLANHHDTLAGFTSAFVAYTRVHRGVRTVTQGYWTRILESDLKPLLYMVQWTDRIDQIPTGTEIVSMRDFLEATSGLSTSSLEACLSALDWIQWILDLTAQEPTRADLAIHATMAWPLLISDDFIDILHKHQPEGLVVLSYYALVLHRRRDFWVFGGSGKALFQLIKHHIGSYWYQAIAKLQDEIAQDEDIQDG